MEIRQAIEYFSCTPPVTRQGSLDELAFSFALDFVSCRCASRRLLEADASSKKQEAGKGGENQ